MRANAAKPQRSRCARHIAHGRRYLRLAEIRQAGPRICRRRAGKRIPGTRPQGEQQLVALNVGIRAAADEVLKARP